MARLKLPKRRMKRPRQARLSLNVMIPNMLTLMAMSAGLTAIRFASESHWKNAALAILAAAILDALDGRIARLLKGTSRFGAELDSLSDILSFGVAPGLILYFWSLQNFSRIGWILVLLYAVSCALRLARYNTMIEVSEPPIWASTFFTGVPAPAAAGVVLLPLIVSFNLFEPFMRSPEVVATFMVLASFLMVSRIPTYSFKKVRLRPSMILPLMMSVGLVAASMMSAPWITLSGIMVVYLISILFSMRSYRALCQRTGACDTHDVENVDQPNADTSDDPDT